MPNAPVTIGQPWGYCFDQDPTPQDSDYPLHTLSFTLAGDLFLLIDNTPDAAVWKRIGDPQQGTWIPKLMGSTKEGSATYDRRSGRYFLSGALCTAFFEVDWTSGTGEGVLRFSAPFATANLSPYYCALGSASVLHIDWGTLPTPYNLRIEGGKQFFEVLSNNKSGADIILPYSTKGTVRGTISYKIQI